MSREYDVLVVGDSNLDVQLGRAPAQLTFGQEEQLMDSGALTLGGSAAITACGAARLGLRAALVSVLGDDGAGRFVLAELAARGVGLSGCVVDEHLATGITVNLVRGDDRAMLTFAGAMSTTSARMVSQELLATSRHVHVTSLFLQPRLAAEVGDLLAEAHRSGATTSLDTGWDPSNRWECGLAHVLPHVDVLLPNSQEALAIASVLDLAGAPLDLAGAAAALAKRGPLPVIKCGVEGAVALVRGHVVRAEGRAADVVDTVGAGDSFNAGFLAGWLGGHDVAQSLALAVIVGTLSTRGAGGTAMQPTLDEAMAAGLVMPKRRPSQSAAAQKRCSAEPSRRPSGETEAPGDRTTSQTEPRG